MDPARSVAPVGSSADSESTATTEPDEASDTTTTEPSVRRQAGLGFVIVLLVFIASPTTDGGDGFLAVPSANSLLYDGDLDLSEFADSPWYDTHYGVSQIGDKNTNFFPWISAALAVPTVAAWDALSSTGAVTNSAEIIDANYVSTLHIMGGSLPAAAGATLLGLLTVRLIALMYTGGARWSIPKGLRRWHVTACIVVLGLGTSIWSTASRSTGQHAASVLLASAAMLLLVGLLTPHPRGRLQPWAALVGVLLSLAYWARPTNAILAVVVLIVLAVRRRPLVIWTAIGAISTHLAILAANLVLVGRAIPPYFATGRLGIHSDYGEAVLANLVSPARGVLLFSPFLLGLGLLVPRGRRKSMSTDFAVYAAAASMGTAGLLLAVSAFEESWWAGLSYGPRFMTEAIVLIGPLSLIGLFGSTEPIARWTRKAAIGAVLVLLSIGFHAGGAVLPEVRCWNERRSEQTPPGVWDWREPQILEGTRVIVQDGLNARKLRPCRQ